MRAPLSEILPRASSPNRSPMPVTQQLLSKFPILKPLPEQDLLLLAQQAQLRKVKRRGVVLQSGVTERHLCFLFEGRLQGVNFTIDGREVGLYFVEPGDFCGELSLFDHGPQPEFVMALTPSVVVMLAMDAVREVMQRHPAMVAAFGQRVASRVRHMTQQRALLGLPNIPQRVCCQLWELVPVRDRREEAERSVILNPPTHQEIAIMLNVSRETVTRVFQSLQNRQIVKRDGASQLQVFNLPSLKQLAEGTITL